MSKEIEDAMLDRILGWVKDYRLATTDPVHISAAYWLEDVMPVLYHSDEYDVSIFYYSRIFNSVLSLKVYKVFRGAQLPTSSTWKMDLTNDAINEISKVVFRNLEKYMYDC